MHGGKRRHAHEQDLPSHAKGSPRTRSDHGRDSLIEISFCSWAALGAQRQILFVGVSSKMFIAKTRTGTTPRVPVSNENSPRENLTDHNLVKILQAIYLKYLC